MKRILYGIGVGPGEPELMTIKAYHAIQNSDVIILPAKDKESCYAYQVVVQICPEIEEKEILCRDFPMRKEALEKVHDMVYQEIADLLEQGKNVAFLTLGDPSVYSTYTYMEKRARGEQKETVTISGVPSFCAACARLGIPLAENKEQIHIIPASYEVKDSLSLPGTKVYMKAGKKLAALKEQLEPLEQAGEVVVYAVTNCGMPGEKLYYSIKEIEDKAGYFTLLIVKEP